MWYVLDFYYLIQIYLKFNCKHLPGEPDCPCVPVEPKIIVNLNNV